MKPPWKILKWIAVLAVLTLLIMAFCGCNALFNGETIEGTHHTFLDDIGAPQTLNDTAH